MRAQLWLTVISDSVCQANIQVHTVNNMRWIRIVWDQLGEGPGQERWQTFGRQEASQTKTRKITS
eukprot:1670107-Amphidinium_carterae.1